MTEEKQIQTQIISPEEQYQSLLGKVRETIDRAKFSVGVEILRMKYTIGDTILRMSDSDEFKKGPSTNSNHKTLTRLSEDLSREYPQLTRPRLSECVIFRKKVGTDFDVWVETEKQIGVIRRDIQYYILPNALAGVNKTEQQLEKEALAKDRAKKKADADRQEIADQAVAQVQTWNINESIEKLGNMIEEGHQFTSDEIIKLRVLASIIKDRYGIAE